MSKFNILRRKDLGDNVPKRNGTIAPTISNYFMKAIGWKVVGDIPDVPQAVFLALPHTSNMDGVFAIPTILSLNININIIGKKSLFNNPVVGGFLKWAGVIPIDRSKKGSVLQNQIDMFKKGEPLMIAIAPEGTRSYSDKLKTGFYYIALGAEVPMIPIVMDYKTKEVRFLGAFYPTGDIEADMEELLQNYTDVVPRYPENLAKPLQDVQNK